MSEPKNNWRKICEEFRKVFVIAVGTAFSHEELDKFLRDQKVLTADMNSTRMGDMRDHARSELKQLLRGEVWFIVRNGMNYFDHPQKPHEVTKLSSKRKYTHDTTRILNNAKASGGYDTLAARLVAFAAEEVSELEIERDGLKIRVAELEQKVHELETYKVKYLRAEKAFNTSNDENKSSNVPSKKEDDPVE